MDGRAAYDCSPGAIGGNGLCDSGVGAADTAVNPANFGHPLAIVRTCCWTARSAGLAYRGATGS